MKKVGICLLLVMVPGLRFLPARAQTTAGNAVLRLDPALDGVISVDAKLEALKEEYFGFIEGPSWTREPGGGYLLFSDIPANRIYKWDPKAGLSIFLDHSGFTESGLPTANVNVLYNGRLWVALAGSNAVVRDREGRLLVCAHGDRMLYRLEKDGTRTTLADRYEGKRLSGPNDLAVKSDGSVYFSDRGGGLRGGTTSPERDLPFNAIMRLKAGKLDIVVKDDGANGLAFSPDEKYLYVITFGKIDRYDVQPDGTVANRQVFLDTTTDKAPGSPDGMKVDRKGNIFTSGPGGAWIVSPEGKLLGKILVPIPPANLSFGDADGKGLYLTARTTLYHIRLNAPAF
jgi:gluconolactonase